MDRIEKIFEKYRYESGTLDLAKEDQLPMIKELQNELDKAREEVLEEMIKENGGNIIPSPEAIPTLMFRREIREYLNNKLSKFRTKEDGK